MVFFYLGLILRCIWYNAGKYGYVVWTERGLFVVYIVNVYISFTIITNTTNSCLSWEWYVWVIVINLWLLLFMGIGNILKYIFISKKTEEAYEKEGGRKKGGIKEYDY